MVSVDGSIFVQIINFLFLIFALNFIVYKPIRNILAQRKEKIAGLEQGVEKSESDALAKDAEYGAGIRKAREEGLKEKGSLVQAASDEEKAAIEKINEKAQADLAQIREKIAKEAESVRAVLKEEIGGYADAIGQKILGRTVS